MAATDAQFRYGQGCKGSWGASMLDQMTGEPLDEAFIYGWATGTLHARRQTAGGHPNPLVKSPLEEVIEAERES